MGSRAELRREMPRGLPHVARPVSRIEGSEADHSSGFFACTCVFTGSGQGGKEMNENAPERRVRQGMDYGEDSDVHQVHAAIQREKREPRVGLPLNRSMHLMDVRVYAIIH